MHQNSSDSPIENTPTRGGIASPSYGRGDGINEPNLQSLVALGVEIGCRLQLAKSLGVELKPHHAYFCLSLTNASSPAIPLAWPDRNSCKRRFASSAHSA